MSKKFSELLIRWRGLVLTIVFILTAFFANCAYKIELSTAFKDLLPKDHFNTKLHQEFQNTFGGAHVIYIMMEVKKGDIFNYHTLSKIKEMTDVLELTRGVNPYQIHSLSRHNVKDIKATSWGLEATPLMHPYVPKAREGIEKLRNAVYANEFIYGHMVSKDGKSSLIRAEFLEDKLDYSYLFNRVMQTVKKLEDDNISFYVVGEPILYGWLYHYLSDIIWVMGATALAIIFALWFFLRRLEGIIIPLISTSITAIWGLGTTYLLGFNFDPLTLVVPFVIAARTLSHSVQMAERFEAEYRGLGDKKAAASAALAALFPPAFVAIITDAVGVLIIATASIPLLQKLGVTGCIWMLTDIISVMIMAPILYTYFPISKKEEKKESRLFCRLQTIGSWSCQRRTQWIIGAATFAVVIFSAYGFQHLVVGDSRPGTPLLWPDSVYNRGMDAINSKFPGTNQLTIVVRGNKVQAIKEPEVLHGMENFQREMMKDPKVGGAVSTTLMVKKLNETLHYGHPVWKFVPNDRVSTGNLLQELSGSGEPGDFESLIDWGYQYANITFFIKDHKGDTIREVMNRAKEFIASHPSPYAKFESGCGLIGLLAGANEIITKTNDFNLVAILSFVFICCVIAFRSFLAGVIFVISLVIANFFTMSVMSLAGVGLNINTIPVISLGIGLGVDYGLYIVSRIKDEYATVKDLSIAVPLGVATAGKAVLYTAVLMTFGLAFWYFSPLRFQAEMGILLCIVLMMNTLGALFLLPTLIFLIKPGFVIRR
ncbi:MAG: MMPL family transporter [Syntrophales bacterium]